MKKNRPVEVASFENLPSAPELEDAIVSSFLIEPNVRESFIDQLEADDFTKSQMKSVFLAIKNLDDEGVKIDLASVANRLREMGSLEAVGGTVGLSRMADQMGACSNIEYSVQILRQKSLLRRIMLASHEIAKAAGEPSVNADSVVAEAMDLLEKACGIITETAEMPMAEVVKKTVDMLLDMRVKGVTPGLQTGFPSFDRLTGGLMPKTSVILAGRPGQGKSQVALNLAVNVASASNPVGVFSLEMSSEEYSKRYLMMKTGISTVKMNRPSELTDYEVEYLKEARDDMKLAIQIDDTPSIPLAKLVSRARRMVRRNGIKLLIVDYLQLIEHSDPMLFNREQVVAAISKRLKQLSKELNIPVVALSQLSRQAERGGVIPPMLSDLRESGSLEQDADMVVFVHRPGGFMGDPMTELIVAKHRNGPPDKVSLFYDTSRLLFSEQIPQPPLSEDLPDPDLGW